MRPHGPELSLLQVVVAVAPQLAADLRVRHRDYRPQLQTKMVELEAECETRDSPQRQLNGTEDRHNSKLVRQDRPRLAATKHKNTGGFPGIHQYTVILIDLQKKKAKQGRKHASETCPHTGYLWKTPVCFMCPLKRRICAFIQISFTSVYCFGLSPSEPLQCIDVS